MCSNFFLYRDGTFQVTPAFLKLNRNVLMSFSISYIKMERFNVLQEFLISKRHVSICSRKFQYRNGTFQFVPEFLYQNETLRSVLEVKKAKTDESCLKSQKEKSFHTV
jgi:hypothetical protein